MQLQTSNTYRFLNQWLDLRGDPEITDFEDWLDVLEGTSERQLGDIIERADLQYAAQQQGITLSSAQIDDFADVSGLDRNASRSLFANVSNQINALGSRGLLSSGLSVDHLLYGNAGLEYDGVGSQEIQRRVANTAAELGAGDEFNAGRQAQNPFRELARAWKMIQYDPSTKRKL